MSKLSRVIFAAAFAAGMSLSACADVVVDDELPAGNIVFEKIEGDTVSVHQDLRDTEGAWFYWAMRVTGAAGRTLTFKFTTSDAVGVRGAVVSTDGGKTFVYAGTGVTRRQFTYTFGAEEDETWFYECIPYMPADWTAFLAAHDDVKGSYFTTDVLCQSSKAGVDVPLARFGCLTGTPKYRIVLSSRHHCSETVATYVVEGFAAAFLKDDELGAWLRANVLLTVVPFVDYDGVVAGDQGKNRKPSGSASACDHNRDYSNDMSQSHYTETRALAALVASENPDAWFDIHCPSLSGGCNETLYTPGKESTLRNNDLTREARFSELLQSLQCGSMGYKASDDIPYGTSWNTGSNYSAGMSCIIWALQNEDLTNLKVCRTFEVPFANANGHTVTETTCRDLGADIAKTTKAYLLELESAPADPEPKTAEELAVLPDDYTEVEYVQSTCDQYVDTGYKPNAKTTIHFEFAVDKYDYRELTTSTSLNNDRNNAYVLACYNERCQFAYGSSSFMGFGTIYNNAVKLNKDTDSHCLGITNATFYIDGVSKYTGNTTFNQGSNQQPLYVFALNSSGTPKYLCGAKVYSLIISENGIEKRHYIPAVDAGGKVGLYDAVTGGFHQSKTSTPLVAGPTVGPVSDEPKFSEFSGEGSLSRVWEQVTVSDGAEYNATVEAYMGTDPENWTAISNWTHSVERATYAATNREVTVGATYYCAFKMTYEKGGDTIVKWTATNSVVINGDVHWRGKGADTKWTTAENWKEGLVPSPALTAKFDMGGDIIVSAGDEELNARSVYVTQDTTVWDFQPETALAMRYLHIGASDAKTAANLIVTNGVINAIGSIGFDYSESSVWFAGTKVAFGEKTYLTKVGKTALKVTDGAAVKIADYEQAGNSYGEDSIFVGKDSALTLASVTINSHANILTVDGGVITNSGVFALGGRGDNSQLGSKLVVKNGGRFVQKGTFKLNCWYNNSCEVIDSGMLEAKAINIGNEADSGSGGKLIVSNAMATASSIAVCADDRHRSQYLYLYEDEGECSSITVSEDLVVATSGTNTRNGRTNRVSINGGDLSIGGNLRIGTPFATEQTNKLTIARVNSKVTAETMALNNNSEIVITLPATGFDETPLQITGKATFNHTSGLKIDVSSAKPGRYTVLTASEFAGLDDADISLVNTGKYQSDIIRTETSVGVKVKGSGLTLIYR